MSSNRRPQISERRKRRGEADGEQGGVAGGDEPLFLASRALVAASEDLHDLVVPQRLDLPAPPVRQAPQGLQDRRDTGVTRRRVPVAFAELPVDRRETDSDRAQGQWFTTLRGSPGRAWRRRQSDQEVRNIGGRRLQRFGARAAAVGDEALPARAIGDSRVLRE